MTGELDDRLIGETAPTDGESGATPVKDGQGPDDEATAAGVFGLYLVVGLVLVSALAAVLWLFRPLGS